ncbi:hypothetical protein BGX24_005195 [Mortierella sp. AD032]|nr:hypothetical protein BGX24_005195 [Mortierella sp. AD032]
MLNPTSLLLYIFNWVTLNPEQQEGRISRHLIPEQATPYIPPPATFPPDQWGNRVPDFSQVGYRRGHLPLPTTIPVAFTLQPSIDPRVNDRERIQKAIDWVGRQPFQKVLLPDNKTTIQARGVVLLQAGIYRVQGSLILDQSGVVLRGEGNGPEGTVLVAMGQFKHDFINLNGLQDPSFQSTSEYLQAHVGSRELNPRNPYVVQDDDVAEVADEYIPVGTTRLPVKDVSNFNVGSQVVVERLSWDNWIERLGTDHIPKRPSEPARTMDWDPKQYELRYVRKIKAIEVKNSKAKKSSIASVGSRHGKNMATPAANAGGAGAASSQTLQKSDTGSNDSKQLKQQLRQPHEHGQQLLQDQMNDARRIGPQAVLRFVADTNRTGLAQPLEAEQDFAEIQVVTQEESQSNDSDRSRTNRVPGYLHLDIPLVMNMDPVYGSGSVYNFKRQHHIPSDVGLENLALWSEHDPNNAQDERHAWFAVLVDHCENCWVADVTTRNFVSGIRAAPGSKHVTIQDCQVLDPVSLRSEGGRRYMFMLQGQMGLVKRCFATDARHDFITGAKTAGPNVFVDSEGVRGNNDAGPHDRWTTGTLYDNIHSYGLNVRNRGWMGSGQGWAGAFHVVYQSSADIPSRFQSPPGGTNWVIGFDGYLGEQPIEFEGDDATFLDPESKDIGQIPRSLYWAQLVRRMGNSSEAAGWAERMVGVKGKSRYRDRLEGEGRKSSLTLDEIVLADEAIKSTRRWELNEDEEEDGGEDVEAEERISRLRQDILRMELEIKESGHEHLLDLYDDDEDNIW